MYSRRSGLMMGFHGCDKSIRDKVLSGKTDLNHSQNNWDWLGHGIYFWENNPWRALEFAEEQSKRKDTNIKTPSVIGAVLDLGYCLDLMDMQNISLVKTSYFNLKKTFDNIGKSIPKNLKSLIKRA